MTKKFKTLRHLLSEAVHGQPYDGLLFSGGLDTAVIAALNPKVTAVTVSLEGKAFEDILSKEMAWQSKRPLEYGSGMTRLREIITQKISDNEFHEKQNSYPVKFFNKEHLYYYEIFRKLGGVIPTPKNTEKLCPGCGAGLKKNSFHCKICGCVLGSLAKRGESE